MNAGQGGGPSPGVLAQAVRRGRGFLALLRAAWREYEHDHARFLAGAMVYYALLSLIPLLLLLLSSFGLLLRFSELFAEAQQQLLQVIDVRFGAELRMTIEQLLASFEQQSVIATIIGLITLLLTSSGLFRQLRLSFRAIWRHTPPLVSGSAWTVLRTSLREQAIAFVMVLSLGGLLTLALALIAVFRWLDALVGALPIFSGLFSGFGGWLVTMLLPLAMGATAFGLLLKYLPPVPLRWRDILPAALLCTAGWRVASELLALYGLFFSGNRSAYGALGGLLVIMFWMNIICQMLFFGAELCKVTTAQAGSFAVEHTP